MIVILLQILPYGRPEDRRMEKIFGIRPGERDALVGILNVVQFA
jgi:hypothetical protein